MARPDSLQGFTLIEMVMVMVITSIISSMIAVFIRIPVDSYLDTIHRSTLSDSADTAVRRMARDIRLALPNSVRNPADGSDQCIEFIPTKIGGHYRSAASSSGGNILDFTITDTDGFDMLWPNDGSLPAAYRVSAGDIIVVYNDGTQKGNAYLGANAIQVLSVATASAVNSTAITFVDTASAFPFNNKPLPSVSPTNQFQVIPSNEHVLAYACLNGILYRHARVLNASWPQPNNCTIMTGSTTSAQLARNITSCSIKYDQPGSSTGLSRFGVVAITLGISQSGESVNLYHQIHVDNWP